MCVRGSVPSGGRTGEAGPAAPPEARLLIRTQALQQTSPSLCLNFLTCKTETTKYPPLGLLRE